MRLGLAAEAIARGIQPIEFMPGADLEELARNAVSGGADALAMAGGDGSQAVVAAVAAAHSLPYACVPAGTRNHFALDLGVDRHDVIGALDALVDGVERVVDLAEVNGKAFVNNASLGIYAEAVHRSGYRNAKLRTLLETIPDDVGAETQDEPFAWTDPDGKPRQSHATILVSNNPYRLGRLGSGMRLRPRLDEGLLGIVVLGAQTGACRRGLMPPRPWSEWTAATFKVQADERVALGIDGEAAWLKAPLSFHARPQALKIRIARSHPGAR